MDDEDEESPVLPDPFDNLDSQGRDGYRAILNTTADRISVWVGVYHDGLLYNLNRSDPDQAVVKLGGWEALEAALGEASRLYLVMDAVCRYFNTGGRWSELRGALARIIACDIIPAGLEFPGYTLIDTGLNEDGVGEHVFRNDTTREGVVWIEDVVIDRYSEQALDDKLTLNAATRQSQRPARALPAPGDPGDA